ncbi:MAG: hypothetical protein IMZ69_03160 [Spirochaetes bacterium]|nr:hypothetical protein [Spirochaetota bacterium]
MKVFLDEGPESILMQLTPETREEDHGLVRIGLRVKAIKGGIFEIYSNKDGFFGQIILPAIKEQHGIIIKRGK